MTLSPKAFISHASEDKDRFVVEFAQKMRERGIDAWLDKWEIRPGDSLVEKIFEEGIKNADAFIVVVSANSISKPWVREELDAGMVKKIDDKCKLIPIVIDECEVPATLKHLLWVNIKDLHSYEKELSVVVNTIHGTTEKPPLGSAPRHSVESVVDYLPNGTKADNLVFRALGRRYLVTGNRLLQMEPVYSELQDLGLSAYEINESLEILDGRGYVTIPQVVGSGNNVYAVELYITALDEFMRSELPEYETIIAEIISKVVNESVSTSTEMYRKISAPASVVDHLLDFLELKGFINLAKTFGTTYITGISPELKRLLQQS